MPPAVPGDLLREADLSIEGPEHPAEVWNDRLDLDDEQRAAGWVKSKDVDRPALAVLVERDLGRELPTFIAQQAEHRIGDGRVRRVKESVERFSLPKDANGHGRPQRRSHTGHGSERRALDMTPLEPADRSS